MKVWRSEEGLSCTRWVYITERAYPATLMCDGDAPKETERKEPEGVVRVPLVVPADRTGLRERRGGLSAAVDAWSGHGGDSSRTSDADVICPDDEACAAALLSMVTNMLRRDFFDDSFALQAGTMRCFRERRYDSASGTAYAFIGGPILEHEHALRRLVAAIAMEWPGVRWVGDIQMRRLSRQHVVVRLRNPIGELALCVRLFACLGVIYICYVLAAGTMRIAWCSDYEGWLSVSPAAQEPGGGPFTLLENSTLATAHAYLCPSVR